MTSDTSYTLRVDMWAFDGTTAYAKYNHFRLDGASNNYRLHISGYSGTADKVTLGSQALRALNETTHRFRNISKRQATPSISEQQRAVVSSTKDKMAPVSQETEEEYADFEVVSDEDREKADQLVMQEILTYAGYTLACVIVSVILVICFVADPRACIMAFATGSPCCLMCPWYRDLVKYTDPATLIRANVNIYVPGMYVQPDGVLKEYPPSAEEMDALFDLIGEFLSIE